MVWFSWNFSMRNYYFLSGAMNFYLVCNIKQVAEKNRTMCWELQLVGFFSWDCECWCIYQCQHWSPLERGLSWAVADNEKHRYWPLLYYAAIAALTPIITSSSPYLHAAPHYHSTFFTFCRNSGQIFLNWEEDFNSSRRRYWTLEATPQLV